MRAEDDCRAVRNFIQLLHEHRTLGTQVFDHEAVVHHFVSYVDGCTEARQRLLDDFDGAVDTGAEAAWVGENYLHRTRTEIRRAIMILNVTVTKLAGFNCQNLHIEDEVTSGQWVGEVDNHLGIRDADNQTRRLFT